MSHIDFSISRKIPYSFWGVAKKSNDERVTSNEATKNQEREKIWKGKKYHAVETTRIVYVFSFVRQSFQNCTQIGLS